MSDLHAPTLALQMATEIVGKTGPITIDTDIYAANIFIGEHEKKEDVITLGEADKVITL